MEEKKNENHEKMWNRVKYISKDTEKRVKIEKYVYVWQGRYCRKRASEGPHASLEDSGVTSAKERTVANGIAASGVGIGES